MTTPTPDHQAAATVYLDRGYETAPFDEIFGTFTAAMGARDFDRAQRCLHWLQARLTTARQIALAPVVEVEP